MKDRRTGKELTLADVDGTIPGRAVLIIVDLDDPYATNSLMREDFVEGKYGCTDPVDSCHRLWNGTKMDWPGYSHTVIATPRASYLNWQWLMRENLGITEHISPEDYLKIETEV